jgi:hypothetical protein
MTSQQQADHALAEHRAVMAAHFKACVDRPTQDQYEALLATLQGVFSSKETADATD